MRSSSLALAISAAATLALCAPASAQDGEQWSALYWGFNAGHSPSDTDWDFGGGATVNPDLEGQIYGIQVGYQQQFDRLVLGVEGSYGFANLEGDATCPNPTAVCANSLDGLATAGVRLGLAADQVLLYATGGFAYADIESRVFLPLTPAFDEAGDAGHGGWYAGGGLEYLLNRDVFFGVEYLYVDLEDQDHDLNRISTGAFIETANIDPQVHVIRLRLSAKVVGLFED